MQSSLVGELPKSLLDPLFFFIFNYHLPLFSALLSLFSQEVHIGGLAEDVGSPADSLLVNGPPHRETPHPHPWRPATHSDRELNSTPASELYPSSNRASPEVPQNCIDVWGRRLRVTQVAEIISDVTEPIMEASEPLDENMSRRQQIQVSQSFSLHLHILKSVLLKFHGSGPPAAAGWRFAINVSNFLAGCDPKVGPCLVGSHAPLFFFFF